VQDNTPTASSRVPRELLDAARAATGKPDLSPAVLIRAALYHLTGIPAADAIERARMRSGPKGPWKHKSEVSA